MALPLGLEHLALVSKLLFVTGEGSDDRLALYLFLD
jgi:hypothetical protein